MKAESRARTFFSLGLVILITGSGAAWMVRGGGDDGRRGAASGERTAMSPGGSPGLEAAPQGRLEAVQSSSTRAPASRAPQTPNGQGPLPAASLRDAGWEFLRSGDYSRAAQVLADASRQFPQDASVQLGLGISHYRMARHEAAVAALNRALSLNPDIHDAHALLGDLYFKRDELEASVRHYEAAADQDPADSSVQGGLFAARRAVRAEADLQRVWSAHVVLKFDRRYHSLADEVLDRLERLSRFIGSQLGWTAEEPMIVILYSDRDFKELTGSPAWAGGLYDGKIHLAGGALMEQRTRVGAVLAHEFTHAMVHRLSGGHAPTWLQEGLALYFEGRPASWSSKILARHRNAIIPLHALHGSFLGLPPGDAELAYAEGDSATRAMIDQYDFVKIRQLLTDLAARPDFAAAFEAVFHRPYRDFETAWIRGLTGRRA
ncbi:MAG: tetratricopeptide repeat protein [Nitrospiraceae bacterium]